MLHITLVIGKQEHAIRDAGATNGGKQKTERWMARRWSLNYAPHLGLTAPDAPMFRESARSADPVDQIRFLHGLGFAGIEDHSVKLRPPAMQARK